MAAPNQLIADSSLRKSKLTRQQTRRLYHSAVLLATGLLFTLLVWATQPFFGISQGLTDKLFVSEPPPPNIVIAGIDDETLSAYGRVSDWPRRLHAEAVNNLATAGARVIGFDVLFVDPSPDDEILAAAIEKAGKVVVPMAFAYPLPASE